jgi:hypothetical protein
VAEEPLSSDLTLRLAGRFAQRVVEAAELPSARKPDLHKSCELSRDAAALRLTCTITGSSYERLWDGSEGEALALVDEAADSTTLLVTQTPRYAWLRSGR